MMSFLWLHMALHTINYFKFSHMNRIIHCPLEYQHHTSLATANNEYICRHCCVSYNLLLRDNNINSGERRWVWTFKKKFISRSTDRQYLTLYGWLLLWIPFSKSLKMSSSISLSLVLTRRQGTDVVHVSLKACCSMTNGSATAVTTRSVRRPFSGGPDIRPPGQSTAENCKLSFFMCPITCIKITVKSRCE